MPTLLREIKEDWNGTDRFIPFPDPPSSRPSGEKHLEFT
jgi:hypothetical protein